METIRLFLYPNSKSLPAFGHPVSSQITNTRGILVIQMPLQRVPPAEHLEAAPNHHATVVQCGVTLMRILGVPLRHTTADPFVLLQVTSVSLEVAFEIGCAPVYLDVSTSTSELVVFGAVK